MKLFDLFSFRIDVNIAVFSSMYNIILKVNVNQLFTQRFNIVERKRNEIDALIMVTQWNDNSKYYPTEIMYTLCTMISSIIKKF